jgi:DNA primase
VSAFRAVKEAVPLKEYAGELTELRRSGGVLVGRCPLQDHEDRTPSFTVWPDNDSWWCFGCPGART